MNGYNEIQNPLERYGVIDRSGLLQLCGIFNHDQFTEQHRQWVNDAQIMAVNSGKSAGLRA